MRHPLALAAVFGLGSLGLASSPALALGPGDYWTGAYLGLQGGHSTATAEFTAPGEAVPFGSLDLSGGMLGVRGGFDVQRGNFVFGILGDINLSNVEANVVNFGGFGSDVNATIDRVGSFRGRVGVALANLLVYGTGGLAVAHVDATVSNLAPGDTENGSDSNTHVGWAAGLGAELALNGNLTLGAEWLHADYGDRDYHFEDAAGTLDANTGITSDTFLVSLNFRLR